MIVIPIIAFFILLFAYFFYKHYSHQMKRKLALKKVENKRIPWLKALKEETTLFNELHEQDQKQLLNSILTFYGEKTWSESLTDNECLMTSYYACLPIFKRKTNYYPSIKEINEFWKFKKWLSMNEKQFEIDFGKLALKEMKGKFSDYSLLFFEDHKNLQEQSPKTYSRLLKFYKLQF